MHKHKCSNTYTVLTQAYMEQTQITNHIRVFFSLAIHGGILEANL